MATIEAEHSLFQKNRRLGLQLSQLRQSIDMDRLIGLNVDQLEKHGVSNSFWGYTQRTAREQIVILLCKCYEREDRYKRNSIPGVIAATEQGHYSESVKRAITRFGKKYGIHRPCECPRCYLADTLELFRTTHADDFKKVTTYRNKFGAHSEAGAKPVSPGSHRGFETLFAFALDFYNLAHEHLADTVPAFMGGSVQVGARQVMQKLGIEKPQFEFTRS